MNTFLIFIPEKKENKFQQEYVYAEIQDYINHKKEEDKEEDSVIVMQIT